MTNPMMTNPIDVTEYLDPGDETTVYSNMKMQMYTIENMVANYSGTQINAIVQHFITQYSSNIEKMPNLQGRVCEMVKKYLDRKALKLTLATQYNKKWRLNVQVSI